MSFLNITFTQPTTTMFGGNGRLAAWPCGTIGLYLSLLEWLLWDVPDRGRSCTIHRVIPGTYEGPRKGIRTTVFGEKRKMLNHGLVGKQH